MDTQTNIPKRKHKQAPEMVFIQWGKKDPGILDEMVAGIQKAFATLNTSPSHSSYAGCLPIIWGATPLNSSLKGRVREERMRLV